MLKNYIKIALRNLKKNKTFSLINIIGLAIGLTCSLLIALWVADEYRMDAYHEDGDRTYVLYERQYYDGRIEAGYYTPALLPEELKRVFPNVEYAAGLSSWNNWHTFSTKGKIMKLEGRYAGKNFFRIFSFPLVYGTKDAAINIPEGIAISRTMAISFFGSPEAAINQTLLFENEIELTVTAVFDIPAYASGKFNYLLNWDLFLEQHSWANNWKSNGSQTYVKLRSGTDPVQFESQIKSFLDNYNKDQGEDFQIELGMQKFEEMYLHSRFENGAITGGKIDYVRIFSIVAVFILFIACINFMNLATAQSANRAREIGVRKVVGAHRLALIRQFLSESFIITLLSIAAALIIATLFFPAFNELTGKNMHIPFGDATFWTGLALLTIITSIISGSYPSFMLSSFHPAITLKGGKTSIGTGNAFLRKSLVVFQFILSILFVAVTLVISQQVDYIQTVNLGYEKENLLYLPLEGKLFTNFGTYKDEALKIPGIESVTRLSQRPVELENSIGGVNWEGKDPGTQPRFSIMSVDYDFVENMKIKVLEGRDFSKEFGADSLNYLINESALTKIGYEDPIGKKLSLWGNEGTLIGVLKDFHFNSLYVPIEPMIIRMGVRDDFNYALIRTAKGKTGQVLQELESLNADFNPGFPFSHQFADQEYAGSYQNEYTVQQLSGYFTFLAIFISCLGLLGLVMYTAEQRTREIGIRKVLGATVKSLFALLSKEYVALVAIAFVMAVPVSIWILSHWLQNFSYHVDIDWWIFLITGLSIIIAAIATVSFHVIRVSLINPAKSLRTE